MHSPIVLRYVAEKVNASKKYIWIHNDFSTTDFPVGKYGEWLEKYDAIVGVSRRLSEEFSERCPQCTSKADGIKGLILDPQKREVLAENLEQRDSSNNGEINELLEFIRLPG